MTLTLKSADDVNHTPLLLIQNITLPTTTFGLENIHLDLRGSSLKKLIIKSSSTHHVDHIQSKSCISLDNCLLGGLEVLENDCIIELENFNLIADKSETTHIQLSNSILVTKNSKFSGLRSLDRVIYSVSGTICVINSAFENNEAQSIINTQDDELTIINSNFTGNKGFGENASVLRLENLQSITIHASLFRNNYVAEGSVISASRIDEFNVANSSFDGNKGKSGAVFNLTNITSFTSQNDIYHENLAFESGGVFSINESNINLFQNSSFSRNSAGLYGGSIYCEYATFGKRLSGESFSRLLIQNSVFINNTSGHGGGAISVISQNSNWRQNISDRYYFHSDPDGGYNLAITSMTEIKNLHALQISINKCSFQSNYGHQGGVLYSEGDVEMAITASLFKTNSAINGGVVMAASFSSYSIQKCSFLLNTAQDSGGIIFSDSSIFSIEESNLSSNMANYGGVASLINCKITFAKTILMDNMAKSHGSMLQIMEFSNVIIQSSSFRQSADSKIGVIYGTSGILRISNCSIIFDSVPKNTELVGTLFEMSSLLTYYTSKVAFSPEPDGCEPYFYNTPQNDCFPLKDFASPFASRK